MRKIGLFKTVLACAAAVPLVLSLSGCQHSGTSSGVSEAGAAHLAALPYSASYQTVTMTDTARQRKIPVTFWYPSNAAVTPKLKNFSYSGIWQSYYQQKDAQPAAGHHPLIMLSHGTGGTALSQVWIAEYLAAAGYWVVGVDHPNDSWPNTTEEGFLSKWERALDVSFLLDQFLSDERYAAYIDADRIGALGHSSGGSTVLSLAGAIYQPKVMQAYCFSPEAEPSCSMVNWELHDQMDLGPASLDYTDERIKAVAAMAPAITRGLTEESLAAISVPVFVLASDKDENLKLNNIEQAVSHIPNAELEVLEGAGHFVYLGLCNNTGKSIKKSICVPPEGIDRDALQQEMEPVIKAFFDQNL